MDRKRKSIKGKSEEKPIDFIMEIQRTLYSYGFPKRIASDIQLVAD